MQHLGDITKISGYSAPTVDCVIGGSPCQDLSVAGKRAGLDGERSGLYMEQIRIIKEMRAADVSRGRTGVDIRPRYMVWENVPGAFSSNGGEDFRIVLEEAAKVADKDASVPRPPDGKWQTAGCIMADRWSISWRVLDAQFWGVPQRRRRIALVADFGGQSASEILFIRKSVSGHSEPCGEKRKGASADAQGCPGTDDRERVSYSIENHPADSRVRIDESGMVQALTSRMGTSDGNVPLVMEPYAIGNGQANQTGLHEKAGTLNCTHGQQAVLVAVVDCRNGTENPDVNGTLQAKSSGGTSCNINNVVRVNNIVRRLTPMECERLQGFPDSWTDIGKWVDSKGKKHRTADSYRYKALGNSIALPQWKWVLKRICSCYERDATMASLFDGIGGFPLIWEQINGKGSCIWASEIEDFPIAVTKARIKWLTEDAFQAR